MTDALLVDRDGTLFDTCRLVHESYCAAFEELGLTAIDIRSIVQRGLSIKPTLADVGLSSTQINQLRGIKEEHFSCNVSLTRLNQPLFERIQRFGGSVALVTNGSNRSTARLLDYHRMGETFDLVICGDDVASPKPSPDCYVLAMESLGVTSTTSLAIEDSEIGAYAARAAGVETEVVDHFCSWCGEGH